MEMQNYKRPIIERDSCGGNPVLSLKNEDDSYPFQIGVNRAKLLKAALESEPGIIVRFIVEAQA